MKNIVQLLVEEIAVNGGFVSSDVKDDCAYYGAYLKDEKAVLTWYEDSDGNIKISYLDRNGIELIADAITKRGGIISSTFKDNSIHHEAHSKENDQKPFLIWEEYADDRIEIIYSDVDDILFK